MSAKVIRVSGADDSRLEIRIVSLDFELRLFEDGSEVLGAQVGQAFEPHPLSVESEYVVRYNNNNGGMGVLHYQILECRTQEVVRHEVNISNISAPEVIEQQFSFQRFSEIPAPA